MKVLMQVSLPDDAELTRLYEEYRAAKDALRSYLITEGLEVRAENGEAASGN